ncbi:MAG: TolC family protein [Candidatus Acidiferrales bacterium]
MRIFPRYLAFVGTLIFFAQGAAGQQTAPAAQLTLRRAVELALRNSRDVELARLHASLASQTAGADRSKFLPNLVTGSGAEYSSGFPLAPGGGVPALFQVAYSQSIYNPLAKGQLRADELRAREQTASLDSVREAVMVRTANAYLELTNVRHALDLLRTERDHAQKITDLTRDRVSAGRELPVELTKTELNAAKIEQRIAHNEGREDALESQLRDMLGLQPDQPLEVISEDLPAAAERPVNELVAQALQSSADLRYAQTEQLAKEEILKGARGNRWPTVDLVGNYSVLSNTNNFSAFFKKFQRNNVNVGVQITIPIFAAQTNAAISVAQEDASVAAVEARNKRSQVELQVRSQAHLVRELELGRDVARLDLKLAQENLQVLQAQFDEGRATRQELERAHLEENDKWLAFFDADLARQQASLALLQATGQVSTILK